MPAVCNAMLAHLRRTAPAGLPYCHGFIYSNTIRGSSFRKTLVDMLIKESRFGDFCIFPPDYGANSEPSQIVPHFPTDCCWSMCATLEGECLTMMTSIDPEFLLDLKNELVKKLK